MILIIVLLFGSLSASVFEKEKDCAIHQNESVHLVMDRVCDMCHELANHLKPNMRAECRAECFSTETFRKCLALFSAPRRHTRHRRL